MRPLAPTLLLLTAITAGCQVEKGAFVKPGASSNQAQAINAADARLLAMHLVEPKSKTPITVTSTDFKPGGEIAYTFTDYGDKVSPQLSFANVPKEAKTLVVLMEDPDAQSPKPFIHWVLYDLPATTQSLQQSIPPNMQLVELDRTPQGLNSRGSIGYMGPRPPHKDPAHHYHFQVFALDKRLNLPAGADRASVVNAMKDHVLASGVLVGTYKAAR